MNSLHQILGVPLSNLCLEFIIYVMFLWQLRSAWVRERRWAWTSLSLAAFAYALEFLGSLEESSPTNLEAMHYGRFLVMLPSSTPLWIVLGWVVLMSTAMRNTERLGGPFLTRPIMVGLLALGFSLSLDPVAVFSGWYTFDVRGAYFGVPSDHALLYFACAFFQSLFTWGGWRILKPDAKPWLVNVVAPAAAALLSLVAVSLVSVAMTRLYVLVGGTQDIGAPPWTGQSIVFALMFGGILGLLILFRKDWCLQNPIRWSAISVPLVFFPVFMVVCILKNAYVLQPELPIALLCNSLFSSLIWVAPSIWRFL